MDPWEGPDAPPFTGSDAGCAVLEPAPPPGPAAPVALEPPAGRAPFAGEASSPPHEVRRRMANAAGTTIPSARTGWAGWHRWLCVEPRRSAGRREAGSKTVRMATSPPA